MAPDDAGGALGNTLTERVHAGKAGKIFFLGDALDTLDHEWDSSLRLKAAYQRRGRATAWATYEDIMVRGRTLVLAGEAVGPDDLVWLRFDPSVSIRYYETLRALCHVEARMINHPAAVLTVHDKRAALELCPRPTYSLFSSAQLAPAVAEMRGLGVTTLVLKPPSLFGSKGVQFIAIDDAAALMAGFAELVGLFGYVIAEPYLGPGNGKPPIDTRVLLTCDRVIGVIERVIPPGGRGLHDVTAARPFSPVQSRLVGAAMDYMRGHGIFLAGLDFLGDHLTELNVSCPGAIPEINLFCHIQAEDEIVADLLGAAFG
jgi:glutathione synthase